MSSESPYCVVPSGNVNVMFCSGSSVGAAQVAKNIESGDAADESPVG
jgi:hypothetical protein